MCLLLWEPVHEKTQRSPSRRRQVSWTRVGADRDDELLVVICLGDQRHIVAGKIAL